MKRLIAAVLAACLVAPAFPKVIAEARATNEALALTDEQGPCPAGAQVAVWAGRGKEPVVGCWFEAFAHIWIIFEDGDRVGLPKQVFKTGDL